MDLRPVPQTATAVAPEGFAMLLSMLTGSEKLDGWDLSQAVDAADLETKVCDHLRHNLNFTLWCWQPSPQRPAACITCQIAVTHCV